MESAGLKPYILGYTTEQLGKRRKEKIKMALRKFDGFIDEFVILDSREELEKDIRCRS